VVTLGLRSFIARRIVYSIVLIVLVIIIDFFLFILMPGNPAAMLMSAWSRLSPQQRQQQEYEMNALWGLNDPLYIQLFKYIRNLLTWNFGDAIVGREPISVLLAQKIPYTLLLLGGSTILSLLIGLAWGMMVIQRRGSSFDTSSVVTSLIMGSLPTFWIGLVLLWLFAYALQWFPGANGFPVDWTLSGFPQAIGMSSTASAGTLTTVVAVDATQTWALFWGYFSHLILPLTTLTLFSYGGWLLLTRATMLDAITEDYVVTARAKGLSERSVLYRHALKNASLPIITSAAMAFGFVLSGAIITETVFSYPGVGAWVFASLDQRDYSVLMAFFYVISLCVIIANIVADLLYGIIDPRIKYG
jgi:peptide/nickel transport system permease protein